jgi:uncharacterized GH25 family protein
MKKSKATLAIVFCLGLCLLAGAAWAHDLWLMCPKAKAGEKLTVEIGYGHNFPKDEQIDSATLTEIYVMGTKGKIKTAPGADKKNRTGKPLAAGSYVVAGGTKARFFTKSPAGYVNKPKNEVSDAIKCFRSVKYAKALVNLGPKADQASQPLGQDLEIVPLVNPATLKAGSDLPVKVLMAGKPLAKAEVTATFAGFSKDRAMAFYAKTNSDGVVKVKLWHPGLWLVRVAHKTPYENLAKCDVLSKTTTLTFEIK